MIEQFYTDLVNFFTHGWLLKAGSQVFVLLELWKALERLAVPFFFVNVLEISVR